MSCRRLATGLAAVLLFVFAALPARAERVPIPLADGTVLIAHWMPRPEGGVAPAIVALHGCGGLYNRRGTAFDARYPEYVARLHALGFHVLLPDSFGSRGSGPICAVEAAQRTIKVETRRGDATAAVDWLAGHPLVDPHRIALLGWSHGASTLLSALNAGRPMHATGVAAAVAFYPSCAGFGRPAYRLNVPLLMLLGEKDDWTPPARCLELAERVRREQPGVDLTVQVYPDSYHGFDSAAPVRFRPGIPNGVHPDGVHQGGNPAARAASLRALDTFLAARLGAGTNSAASTLR